MLFSLDDVHSFRWVLSFASVAWVGIKGSSQGEGLSDEEFVFAFDNECLCLVHPYLYSLDVFQSKRHWLLETRLLTSTFKYLRPLRRWTVQPCRLASGPRNDSSIKTNLLVIWFNVEMHRLERLLSSYRAFWYWLKPYFDESIDWLFLDNSCNPYKQSSNHKWQKTASCLRELIRHSSL